MTYPSEDRVLAAIEDGRLDPEQALVVAELMAEDRVESRLYYDDFLRGAVKRHREAIPEPECVCVVSCADDPPTACSLSGEPHVHPNRFPGDVFGACPAHPDAPGDL